VTVRSEVPPSETTEETHTVEPAGFTVAQVPLTQDEPRSPIFRRNSPAPESNPDSFWSRFPIPDYVLTPDVMISSPCSPSSDGCDNDNLADLNFRWDDLLSDLQNDCGQGDLEVTKSVGPASWSSSTVSECSDSVITEFSVSDLPVSDFDLIPTISCNSATQFAISSAHFDDGVIPVSESSAISDGHVKSVLNAHLGSSKFSTISIGDIHSVSNAHLFQSNEKASQGEFVVKAMEGDTTESAPASELGRLKSVTIIFGKESKHLTLQSPSIREIKKMISDEWKLRQDFFYVLVNGKYEPKKTEWTDNSIVRVIGKIQGVAHPGYVQIHFKTKDDNTI
jgi:hypothetical protein